MATFTLGVAGLHVGQTSDVLTICVQINYFCAINPSPADNFYGGHGRTNISVLACCSSGDCHARQCSECQGHKLTTANEKHGCQQQKAQETGKQT